MLVEQIPTGNRTAEYTHVMLKGRVVLSGLSKELGEEEIKKAYFGL